MGGGWGYFNLIVNIFFGGLRFFSSGVEKFSGEGGLKFFFGGGVRNFRGVEKFSLGG